MKKFNFLIILLFFVFYPFYSLPSFAKAENNINFHVNFSNTNFFLDRDQESKNDYETIETGFNFKHITSNFELIASPKIKIDFLNSDRNRILPQDTYVKYKTKNLNIGFGFEKIHFGKSSLYNPTDVINRRDLESHFLTPEKLAEVLFHFKAFLPDSNLITNQTLSLFISPLFIKTPLPENNTRFALKGIENNINYSLFDSQQLPQGIDRFTFAIDYNLSFKNTDINLILYHGPEHVPGFFLKIDNTGGLRLAPFYYNLDMLGLNLESVISNWTITLETALKITSFNDFQSHEIQPVSDNAIPGNYFQYIPGIQYQLPNSIFGKESISFVFEYLGEISKSSPYYNTRIFNHDILFGVQIFLNNTKETQIHFGIVKDIAHKETMFRSSLQTLINSNFSFEFDSYLFVKSSRSPLNYFTNNSYLQTSINFHF